MAASLLMIATVLLGHWLTRPQQSSVRLMHKLNLKELRAAVNAFQSSHGRVPKSLQELRSGVRLSGLPRFEEFEYVAGIQGVLAFQKEPLRRVREGEPWGGHGQVARYDIPAARLVLFTDGSIRFVEESEFGEQHKNLLMWKANPSAQ